MISVLAVVAAAQAGYVAYPEGGYPVESTSTYEAPKPTYPASTSTYEAPKPTYPASTEKTYETTSTSSRVPNWQAFRVCPSCSLPNLPCFHCCHQAIQHRLPNWLLPSQEHHRPIRHQRRCLNEGRWSLDGCRTRRRPLVNFSFSIFLRQRIRIHFRGVYWNGNGTGLGKIGGCGVST